MTVLYEQSHCSEACMLIRDFSRGKTLLNVGNEEREHKLVTKLFSNLGQMLFSHHRNVILRNLLIQEFLCPFFKRSAVYFSKHLHIRRNHSALKVVTLSH